jgi:hypothetical protein
MAEVGRIILDVQKEIAQLREALLPAGTSATGTSAAGAGFADGSVAHLHDVLARAESELQSRADLLLESMTSSDVQTLAQLRTSPISSPDRGGGRGGVGPSASMDALTAAALLEATHLSSTSMASADGPAAVGAASRAARYGKTRGRGARLKPPPRAVGPPLARGHRGDAPTAVSEEDIKCDGGCRAVCRPPLRPRPRAHNVPATPLSPSLVQCRSDTLEAASTPPESLLCCRRRGVLSLVNRGILPPNVDASPAFEEGAPCVLQVP